MEMRLSTGTIEQILENMTVAEKAELVTGGLPYGTAKIERLGIPAAFFGDSMAGINFRQLFANLTSMETGENILVCLRRGEKILEQLRRDRQIHPEELDEETLVCYEAIKKHLGSVERIEEATCFPAGITLGSTWNPEIVYQSAEALGREFISYGIDVLLTPNVNIQRDPLGGRLFESYSEDPYLTGMLGSEFVKGIQNTGLLADPKHFSANNHEKERKGINVHVSERALREIYFPGFEACVKKGNAKTVMSAYNKLNGTACSANHDLLTKLLREEWGFDGFVISDWGGVYDSTAALLAGNDMEKPGNFSTARLIEQAENGLLPMEVLDTSVRRILKALTEMPCMTGKNYPQIDRDYSEQAAYMAVAEGTVLLKNDGVLPMKAEAVVDLVGDGVHQLLESGSGSAEVLGRKYPGLYECMKAIGGEEHIFADQISEHSEYVVLVGKSKGQEGTDRESMLLDPEDQVFVTETLRKAKAAGKKTVLVLNIAGPVDVSAYEAYADAIITVFIPGGLGSRVLADIFYGKINPSGKLAVTFPEKYEDCPTAINFPGYNSEIWYGEGIYVGYRYYDKKQIAPKYPFGFGMSYTEFEITQVITEKQTFEDETICFKVDIKNTGNVYGKEVVQIYLHHENPFLQKPYKELKTFQKVGLEPGESKTLSFELELSALGSYDEKQKAFTVEPGMYRILAGNSSRNITAEAEFAVRGFDPYGYHEQTRIATILEDERCCEIYNGYFGDKCELRMYNDLLGYTPDYPVGKAIRERVPVSFYANETEKLAAVEAFFAEIGRLDLGKIKEGF